MAVRDEAKKDWEQGMKRKEIAEKYGVSENTVKSWITSAKTGDIYRF